MDLQATKDDHEREQDEAERLVRPSPKVKPPRRDKRRDTVKPEHDPDLDGARAEHDPDLSLNYKGRSAAERVLARYIDAKVKRPKKPGAMHGRPRPKPKAAPAPKADKKLVPAWSVDEERVVQISEDTLKSQPGKYKPVKDKPEKGEGKPGAKPEEAPKPIKPMPVIPVGEKADAGETPKPIKPMPIIPVGEKAKDKPAEAKPEPDLEKRIQQAVQQGIESGHLKTRDIETALKVDWSARTQEERDLTSRALQELWGLPEGTDVLAVQQTLRKLYGKPEKPKAEKKPASPAKPDAPKSEATKPSEAAPEKPQDAPVKPEAPKAEEPSKDESEGQPEPAKGEPEKPSEPEPKAEKPKAEKKPKEPKKIEPKRREVSKEEHREILEHAAKILPKDMLKTLAGMHPDDVSQVTTMFQRARATLPPDASVSKLAEAGSKFYATDPSQVKPPAKALNAQGEEKPWEELNAQEQADAMVKHTNMVIAKSLALREHISAGVARATGAPPELARNLSGFMLTKPENETADQRQQRAERMAEKMFSTALEGEMDEIPMKSVREMLKIVSKDPGAQAIAVAYLQGRDFQAARKRFLDPDSPEAITEHQSPREIAGRLSDAADYLRSQSERYPESTTWARDTAGQFRKRVLDKLMTLAPEKYPFVLQKVQQAESDEYEANEKRWGKQHVKLTEALGKVEIRRDKLETSAKKQYDQAQKELEKAQAKAQAAYERAKAKQQSKSPYREAPSEDPGQEDLEEAMQKAQDAFEATMRQIQKWHDKERGKLDSEADGLQATQFAYERHRPTPPPHYQRKGDKGEKRRKPDPSDEFWGDLFEARAASLRVAIRFAFSTFASGGTMNKSAVYWGVPVDREGITPYPDWQQAHQRDLDEPTLNGILRSAREWLKTPVLSTAIEGIVPDTQLRAALDLAIRTHEDGRYSVGLHPRLYDHLLAKLAGKSSEADATLLTVREASDGSVYAPSRENPAMKTASAQIRAFATRVAESNPELAYDLVALADKVAQEDKGEGGKAFPGAAPPFGKKDDKGDDDKGQDKKASDDPKEGEQQTQEQQSKEASYTALRSAVIHTAAMNPQAKAALLPVLTLIKKLG